LGRPRKSSARTSEAREEEMIALATNRAEQMIRDGTAPAPIVMMYAKEGMRKAGLERDQLRAVIREKDARIAQLEAASQSNEKLDTVLRAFRRYSGQEVEHDDVEDIY
jgi:hypothetical protein